MAVSGTGTSRANFGDLLEPGFRTIFFDQYEQIPQIYSQIFHVISTERPYFSDSSVSGFGQLVETNEGSPLTYEDPVQGFDVTYTPTTFMKGFKVTRQMYEDDLYNVMAKMPARLGQAARRTEETKAGDIFDNAFTSGTGGDGSYLCVTNHAREDGGTAQSNKLSGNTAPSETTLETTFVAMRGTLDAKGQKMLVRPNTILIPKELEKEVMVLMQSSGRTATNYNEINPYEGRLKVVVWDYLDSTQAWFVLDSGLHQLNFVWRTKAQFERDNAFDTKVALYSVYERFTTGFSDWRGVYGSTGTQ